MFVRAARHEILSSSFVKTSLNSRCRLRSNNKNGFLDRRRSRRSRWSLSDTKASIPASEVIEERTENDVSAPEGQETVRKERSNAYPFPEIEEKWQSYWKQNKTFRIEEVVDTSKPKFYVLDMFPYPSGSGLHVGHPEGYTATDIIARYKRAKGFNVLHPMGWDAFGLPAEQYALQTNTHPRITTERNINRFREQLQSLGFSYDWDREISTTDPSYYKWTQWIFLKLFEKGLAYQAEVPVNWCPALGTVLANEEVIDGKSERGSHPVVRLPMKQWMLKITEYADRLLDDLEDLDWSESIKDMQRNWIGRSEGAEILFSAKTVDDEKVDLEVFTTRPDTIFGATYMVLAPEHKLAMKFTTTDQKSTVDAYITAASQKSDLERTGLQKDKSGVFTGSYATNPVTQEQIPIWIADYVLGSYGSGAIMAVPAHDERDFEFASKFNLPIRRVISSTKSESEDDLPFADHGICVNSTNQKTGLSIDGLDVKTATVKIVDWLNGRKLGSKKVNFKLRDWLFARQRYWGEPFPIIYPEGSEVPVAISEDELPLVLPDTTEFKPSGTPESPLANIKDWTEIYDESSSNGGRIVARRETSTMPQWAGSCWYYLRFIDPLNNQQLIDKALEKYWMPVDLYVGGTEHAVLHLLYARFWHKVLYDLGVVSTKEPFQRLVSQGMILGEVEYIGYKDKNGQFVSEDFPDATQVKFLESEVIKKGSLCFLKSDPSVQIYSRSFKMSKSRGNVINPDDIIFQYGADSLRLYEMFMGPLRDTKVWSTRSVEGVHRFLSRVYRIFNSQIEDLDPTKEQLFTLHTTIKKVTEDTEGLRFNTAIACMMEFSNAAVKWETKPKSILDPFLLLLAPYAPHLAEELWQKMGHTESLTYEPWPQWIEKHTQVQDIDLPIQINGKMRGTISVAKDLDQESALIIAKDASFTQKLLDGKEIKKVIYVQNRILNIVVK